MVMLLTANIALDYTVEIVGGEMGFRAEEKTRTNEKHGKRRKIPQTRGVRRAAQRTEEKGREKSARRNVDIRRARVEFATVAKSAASERFCWSMAIDQGLLDMLVCPVCKSKVTQTADESGLRCSTCHRVYPVRDGLPVMLPEEASTADEGKH
jgi:uncharacterized protein